MTSDVELVERSRRRDADAFGALVARHQGLVFGVALAHCRDRTLAEDVAQDAFVAAWRDLDRLRDGARVGPWVAGIARNLAASAARTRARRDQLAPGDADPDAAVDAGAASPEDAVRAREDREMLARALADIPDAHRETLVLYYLEGESVADIASGLGVTEEVVKQRLSRGRRALRQSVAERVESVLVRTRVRPAFGAAVLAAISTAGAREASAAGKVAIAMSVKKLVAIGVGVVVVGGGAALWVGQRARGAEPAPPPVAATPVAGGPGGPGAPPRVVRLPDRAAHDALLAAIRDARERRAASPSAGAPESAGGVHGERPALPADGDLDRAYIQSAVRALVPLLTECYEHGLERDPTLAGTIVVGFTIEGEPGVGGVVADSEVDPDPTTTTLGDPEVRECIQETMYALEIDPPADGGTVRVRYPFAFAPAGSD